MNKITITRKQLSDAASNVVKEYGFSNLPILANFSKKLENELFGEPTPKEQIELMKDNIKEMEKHRDNLSSELCKLLANDMIEESKKELEQIIQSSIDKGLATYDLVNGELIWAEDN